MRHRLLLLLLLLLLLWPLASLGLRAPQPAPPDP
jgi:hypothetical protein